MNESQSGSEMAGTPTGFSSRDCIDIVFTSKGDTTVRPMRPKLRQLALAEKERLAKMMAQLQQEQDRNKTETKNGAT